MGSGKGHSKRVSAVKVKVSAPAPEMKSEYLYPNAENPLGDNSGGGFLKKGEILEEVIQADIDALAAHGVTIKDISDKIEEFKNDKRFTNGYMRGYSEYNNDDFRVAASPGFHRGWQGCPWGCAHDINDNLSWAIYSNRKDLKGKEGKVKGDWVQLHMIQEHNFFEGPAVKQHRIDPVIMARILGLIKD